MRTSIPSGTYRRVMATAEVRSSDRILQSALELFSSKGYDATSVREICEASGITKPTLYHFYGSKEGVYRALVETASGEQGARRTAMKSATDNAGEMLNVLRRTYNRTRQAGITQEIAEIVGGAAALE